MSQQREPSFDRIVALVLRVGAFSCFFIMLTGLIAGFFVRQPTSRSKVERAGVLLMLATPVVHDRCLLPLLPGKGLQIRLHLAGSAGYFDAGSGVRNWRALIAIADQNMCSLMLRYFLGFSRIAFIKFWVSVNISFALL